MGLMGSWAPWAHRARAGRPRRRMAGGRRSAGPATRFGALRNRYHFPNKIAHNCFGHSHIYILFFVIRFLQVPRHAQNIHIHHPHHTQSRPLSWLFVKVIFFGYGYAYYMPRRTSRLLYQHSIKNQYLSVLGAFFEKVFSLRGWQKNSPI